jgi:hypothetical protein
MGVFIQGEILKIKRWKSLESLAVLVEQKTDGKMIASNATIVTVNKQIEVSIEV